jgi:opacity protein-like surface antigen
MKFKIYLSLILSFLLLNAEVFAGGGNRNGTAGASELLIPVGTRGIAMGSSIITNSKGLDALYFNPANLARAEHNTNLFLSNMTHIADISVQYGAISTKVDGFGSIAFDIKSLNIGDIEETTVEAPDGTGSTFSPQLMTIGLTYSNSISDRISVGLTANYISEKIALVSASGIAFNIGLSYSNLANINGLDFGIVIRNLGPSMKYDGSGLNVKAVSSELNRPQQYYKIEAASFELPASLEMGVGYQMQLDKQNDLLVTSSFESNNFYGDQYKIGAEYGFDKMFYARAGYSIAPEMDADYNTYGLTAGVGIHYQLSEGVNIIVDYAYRAVKFDALGDNHVISVGLGL